MSTADPLVTVCRDPKDSARARVRLSALDGFTFDSFSHGARYKFSRPMLVAFVAPADIVDGELRRPASHGLTPDRMKVVITRTHNQTVYPMLERAAAAARIAKLAPVARQRVRPGAPAVPTLIRAPVAPVALPHPAASAVPVAPVVPTAPRPPSAPRAPVARPRVENAPTICSRAVNVAAIRARTGLSPHAFAHRLGVTETTAYAWEAGRHSPRARREAALLAMAEDCTRVQCS